MLSLKSVSIICLLCIITIFLYIATKQSNIMESFLDPMYKIYFINLDENRKILDKNKLIADGLVSSKNSLRMGQIGCALSHITILKNIKKQKAPYGIILEDDVIIPDDFSLEQLKLPTDFDICFLGGCNINGEQIAPNWIRPTAKNGAFNLCWHAVLVNKKSAQKILDLLKPLTRPIDSQIREEYDKLKVFYHYPNLISQNKSLRSTRRDIDGLPQSKYWQNHHLDVTIDNPL